MVTYTTPVVSYTETASSTYAYNAAGQRVSKTSTEGTETSTVLYPSAGYEVGGSEKTIYLSGPQGSSATIHYDGATYAVSSNHQDHLGSTAVVTDSSGTLKELLDYNPYGTERLHTGASSTSALPSDEAQKTYIGEYSDDDSGLSYLNARYYDAERGQFLSEDPAQMDERLSEKLIYDPQSLNYYAYAGNNPIKNTDPTGEEAEAVWYNPATWDVNWKTVGVGVGEFLLGVTGIAEGVGVIYGSTGLMAGAGSILISEGTAGVSVGTADIINGFSGEENEPIGISVSTGIGSALGPNELVELIDGINENMSSMDTSSSNQQNFSQNNVYVVQQGDTLSGVFGDNWQGVADYNNLPNPNEIQIGQEISIPEGVSTKNN